MNNNVLYSLLFFFAFCFGSQACTHYTIDDVLNLIEENNTTLTEEAKKQIQEYLEKNNLNNDGLLTTYSNKGEVIIIGFSKIENYLIEIKDIFTIKIPSMCPLCFTLASKLIQPKKCSHEFCQDCLVRYYANKNTDEKSSIRNHRRCPMCKERLGNALCDNLWNDPNYRKYRKEAQESKKEIIAQAIQDDEEVARQLAQQFQEEEDRALAQRLGYERLREDSSEEIISPTSPRYNDDSTSETI